MTFDVTIQQEKLDQAVKLLQEQDVDMWLTFVRETHLTPDPALDLIFGFGVTWQSAFIVTKNNERIAIVGRYDADNVRLMGGYTDIIAYDEDIRPHLRSVLDRLNPQWIAVNYSESDTSADGLSHGMWVLLNITLGDTPYRHRLISAERIIGSLRGRKSASEIERVRQAVKTTEEIIAAVTKKLAPNQSALELYDFVQTEMTQRGVEPAWFPCPMVIPSPDAPVGHAAPEAKYLTQVGKLVHMDLGVKQNGYVSDIQRVWYLQPAGETALPDAIQRGFEFIRTGILRGAEALKVGAKGWEVDAAARKLFTDYGYPEYQHALGHHIGRSVHDGATVLGPKWARYGKSIEGAVEAGNIFTLELSILVPEYGSIGLEEDVLVTETGIQWLTNPQTSLMVVKVQA